MHHQDSSDMLSRRANVAIGTENINAEGSGRHKLNPYDAKNNPKGIIKLGAAENVLCEQLITEKMNQIVPTFDTTCQYYFHYKGTESFRRTIADFMTRHLNSLVEIYPDHLTVLNGADVVLEQLAYCIADPGECILIPAPFYSVITYNFKARAGVVPLPVPMKKTVRQDGSISFTLTQDILESYLQDAKQKSLTVKGLLVVNPNNPTGEIHSTETIQGCLQFAHRHQLHICFDEVYALSVFGTEPFPSVLSMEWLDPNRTHMIWGFSKDLSLSGFRCGVFYTRNEKLNSALASISCFQNVPALLQNYLERLLKETVWFDTVYLPTNVHRLKEACCYICGHLKNIGVSFVNSKAGFFVWVDFRKWITPCTAEREMQFWYLLLEKGVFINAGLPFMAQEPGWFRIIFAYPKDIIDEGILRIKETLRLLEANPSLLAGIDINVEATKAPAMSGY